MNNRNGYAAVNTKVMISSQHDKPVFHSFFNSPTLQLEQKARKLEQAKAFPQNPSKSEDENSPSPGDSDSEKMVAQQQKKTSSSRGKESAR